MRSSALLPLAVALGACGTSDRPAPPVRSSAGARPAANAAPTPAPGPDAILIRIPRAGGIARGAVLPRLDSTVWTSAVRAAPPAEVLAFDQDAGTLAYVDAKGLPERLDLRGGSGVAGGHLRLADLTSSDGSAIYGISGRDVVRLTPTDSRPWTLRPPFPPRAVQPLADGTVLVIADHGRETVVWRVRPPEQALADTAFLPRVQGVVPTTLGDRVYFVGDSALVSVRGKRLQPMPTVRLPGAVRAVAPTPSGDRLYVALGGEPRLQVIDRYTSRVNATIDLPADARDLRMDPLGRYLLARDGHSDSVRVIALGTGRLIGSVAARWRPDLPLVLPDGAVATAQGNDVALVDGETLRRRQVVRGGAADFWVVERWNGFRPRAEGLDRPVTFASATGDSARRADSAAAAAANDSTRIAMMDSGARATHVDSAPSATTSGPAAGAASPGGTRPPSAPTRASASTGSPPVSAVTGFTVQFAAFPTEDRATEAARAITADGQHPRVVQGHVGGAVVFRVVLGPYATRGDAERVGHDAGHGYWVYPGTP